ncbi:MAG: tripartite tricarboxylate transporter substrate binding protein [Gammaproteobacteria bacterium]|nr:tripartite tricarboxylate transporter substrate binding protein [Gammaproteobacteria bacterium]MBU1440204.1 tripartite tricarboxylate transporter substrate binding protein [Gammaproteobacteria bacterium]MBU2409976.1 tripartite tricarboxylate transporter substrate binding protein [Gammaproteobacteria bacterium]
MRVDSMKKAATLATLAMLLCSAQGLAQAQAPSQTPAQATAQKWPERPIKWIIPYAAGGTSDTLTRIVGQKLGERLGQPIVIENKAGAGGNLGSDFVAKSAPDGYTLLLGNIGPMAVSPTLTKNLPYDPERDLIPISLLMAYGNVIMVNNDFQVKTLKDLLVYGKTHNVSFAGNGVGTSLHLTGEMLAKRGNIKLTHIPYRGGPPGLVDAIAGVVPMVIDPVSSAIPMVNGGKLRALAITSPERSPLLPDVPTVAEQGVPGFEVTGWVGVLVPKGTPEPIVKRLVTEFTAVMKMPEIQKTVADMGSYIPPLGPDYFAKYIRSETDRWRQLIQSANIKVE